MKVMFGLIALVGLMAPLAGCETLQDTKNENLVRVEHAQYTNWMQVGDDLEHIAYIERPVWLSRLPIPNE